MLYFLIPLFVISAGIFLIAWASLFDRAAPTIMFGPAIISFTILGISHIGIQLSLDTNTEKTCSHSAMAFILFIGLMISLYFNFINWKIK